MKLKNKKEFIDSKPELFPILYSYLTLFKESSILFFDILFLRNWLVKNIKKNIIVIEIGMLITFKLSVNDMSYRVSHVQRSY